MRKILSATGISSHSVVYFHCDPERRRAIVKKSLAWRKKNRKRWRKIANKAAKKYYAKKRLV